jgi:hypothetical protein
MDHHDGSRRRGLSKTMAFLCLATLFIAGCGPAPAFTTPVPPTPGPTAGATAPVSPTPGPAAGATTHAGGGVVLALQPEGSLAYPITTIYGYRTYEGFRTAWRDGTATVALALEVPDGQPPARLFYRSDVISQSVSFRAWHDYALLADFSTLSQQQSGPAQLNVSAPIAIGEAHPFVADPQAGTAISLSALVASGANSGGYRYLVLEDPAEDESAARGRSYILIIFYPADGSGDDWWEVWCSDCDRGVCTWVC